MDEPEVCLFFLGGASVLPRFLQGSHSQGKLTGFQLKTQFAIGSVLTQKQIFGLCLSLLFMYTFLNRTYKEPIWSAGSSPDVHKETTMKGRL